MAAQKHELAYQAYEQAVWVVVVTVAADDASDTHCNTPTFYFSFIRFFTGLNLNWNEVKLKRSDAGKIFFSWYINLYVPCPRELG